MKFENQGLIPCGEFSLQWKLVMNQETCEIERDWRGARITLDKDSPGTAQRVIEILLAHGLQVEHAGRVLRLDVDLTDELRGLLGVEDEEDEFDQDEAPE